MNRLATARAGSIVSRASRRTGTAATLAIVTVATLVAGVCVAAQKPYPVYTLDQFVGTMKTLGPNFADVAGSLADDEFEAAKARLVLTRQQLATTITLWRDHGKDDAVAFLRVALEKIDDLDDELSAESVDSAAATAAAREIEAACQACHTVYREQDPSTQTYRLKPGVL